MDRREFCIRTASVTAGTFAFGQLPSSLFAEAMKKQASDRVTLGPMRVELSRLAIGTAPRDGRIVEPDAQAGARGSGQPTRGGLRPGCDLLGVG